MHTPDLTDENIEKISVLFPNCVTEAFHKNGHLVRAIDFDQLKQELSKVPIVDSNQERYQLNWPGKHQALILANSPISKTLRPDREESVNFDETKNLFIEGDNLEALKLLQEIFLNRIKMIYIDPPYNTGKDLIYKDNFRQSRDVYGYASSQLNAKGERMTLNTESNGKFHSDWLSMMYPRIKLARNLLSEDGLIFISIDDNEVDNLRKICDELFGFKQFIACLPTIMNLKGNQDSFGFADTHEYTLCYSKDITKCKVDTFKISPDELDGWSNDEYGLFKKADTLRRTGQDASRLKRPKGWFPIFISPDNQIYVTESNNPNSKKDTILWPVNEFGEELSWTWSKEKIRKEPYNLIVVEGKSGKNIYKKQRPAIGDLPTKKPKSVFYRPEYSTSTATTELRKLFGNKLFEGTKPVPFIKDLLTIGSNKDCFILDFFAGSSSTAHAVMELNAEDGGNRKFIMVQFPEVVPENSVAYSEGYKTISEISKERIRRAAKKIKEENCNVEFDSGFRILKIDESNMREVYSSPSLVTQKELSKQIQNIKEERSSEDLLFQVLIDLGINLTFPICQKRIFGNSVFIITAEHSNILAACFDFKISEKFLKELASYSPQKLVLRDAAFETDSLKINVEQIFKHLSPDTEIRVL